MIISRKILCLVLSLCMLAAFVPLTASAAGEEVPQGLWTDYAAQSFAGGAGTKEDPYRIASAEQLALLAADVNSGVAHKTHTKEYFVLTEDIDLGAHRWTPLGYGDCISAKSFTGFFDGNGKKITGMYVDERGKNSNAGLFGNIAAVGSEDATVQDLTVENGKVFTGDDIEGEAYAAGVLLGSITVLGGGNVEYAVVKNCTVSGVVTSPRNAGGLAGDVSYTHFENCSAAVEIEGKSCSGGFVANAYISEFADCVAKGKVKSTGWSTGGFAGLLFTSNTVRHCAALGDVSAADWNLGGFAGYTEATTVIENSIAMGDVKSLAEGFMPKAGAFVGTDWDGTLSLVRCHAAGAVTALETKEGAVGGMIGCAEDGTKAQGCSYDGEKNSQYPTIGAGEPQSCEIADATTVQVGIAICEDYYGGHDLVQRAATPPSCTEDGRQEGMECTRCAYREGFAPIEKLGHDYKNGACTRCGAEDPNAKCDGGDTCPGNRFTDMPSADNWAHAGIDYAVKHGLFAGMSETTFAPGVTMTRSMLVRVLWKLAGSPAHGEENPFTDVKSGDWFYDGVVWAAENEIVAGMGGGIFAPGEPVTREQIAAILYRYSEKAGKDVTQKADLSAFPDAADVSKWAADALAWANANGYISGTKEGESVYLRPQQDATRAQVASILMRYCTAAD